MRVICIDGVVGSGKTTVINTLYNMLSKDYKVYLIREYIDVLPDAQQKLSEYLSGTMSSYDFQRYILDYHASNTLMINESDYDYVLVERCPIVGLKFFGGLDVKNNRLSEYEFNELMDYAKFIKFLPNPYDESTEVAKIITDKMTPDEISNLAYSLVTGNYVDVILLTAETKTIKDRIIKRGRSCEIESYNDDYLQYMVDNYATRYQA